jgi:hypothetical protein
MSRPREPVRLQDGLKLDLNRLALIKHGTNINKSDSRWKGANQVPADS